jgi:predicted ester cyclase
MMQNYAENARLFWEVGFNQRNLDAITHLFAPNYVNHAALAGTPTGPEGQKQVMKRLWSAFPDASFEIEHVALDGDTVICIGTMRGTHEGELWGISGTGKSIRWRQCHLLKVNEEGQFLEHDAVRDDQGLLRQMGVVPGG